MLELDLGKSGFSMLTRDAKIVQSSHQKGALDNFLACKRRATAMVARTTLTTVPCQTFQATLSSGGKGVAMAGNESASDEGIQVQ